METTTTQDAPAEMLIKLWPWLEKNWPKLLGGLVILLAIFGFYSYSASQKVEHEREAGAALTQLMMSPPAGTNPGEALAQLATKYAGTAAGQRAQLQSGATYFSLAKYAEAQAAFEKFTAENANSALVATAQLGIGASLEAQGKLDLASAAYQRVVSTYANTPSALPAQMGLGRIAESQGKWKDAVDRYDAVARAGAGGGTLAQEALMRANELRPKAAAMTPKPATPAAPMAAPVTAPAPATAPAAK